MGRLLPARSVYTSRYSSLQNTDQIAKKKEGQEKRKKREEENVTVSKRKRVWQEEGTYVSVPSE